MKKHNRQAGKRPLKRLFLLNYSAITGLVLAAIILALLNMDFLMNRFFDKTPDFKQISAADLYEADGTLNGTLLDRYGGWLELLDEEGEVIATKGQKQDDIVAYGGDRLFAEIDMYRNDNYITYHPYSVEGPNGERYVLLWKFPNDKMLLAVGIFAASLLVYLIGALFFYTRYSVRQMKKPLQQIAQGIGEMERFHYEKRLHFDAEQEFAEIRDAFNDMAERLQLASAAKETAERNKQNLLLHLSHDLKTPITSILGYSQLLLDNPPADEKDRRKYVQYIHDKSSYMSKLILDLFELAKLDDEQLKLNLQKVNLTKWYQQKIAEFYPEIEHHGFRLRAEIPETPLYVMVDLVHMDRVVANLIGNALKYNPPGTELYASCEEKDGKAILWLGDSGLGFLEREREQLFEEFVRGSSSGKEGTGLGLAICRKIIERHQGTMALVSDADYPTLFRIHLPSV
ncbi:ATP-binding protein [Paenibacillus sp. TH7-28]